MDKANNIIEYYSSLVPSDSAQDRDNKLRIALESELSKNVVKVDDAVPKMRGGWLFPLILLGVTLSLSLAGLGMALSQYNVEMEAVFFGPTSFFNTEALLIEALKKRTDLEISKRDRLIAEYRRRAQLRDEYLRITPVNVPAAEPQNSMAIPPPAPALEDTVLLELRRQADLDAIYARRLGQSLTTVARQLERDDLPGAAETVAKLRASFLQQAPQDSSMVRSSIAVATAASSVISAMMSDSEPAVEPTIVYLDDPAQAEALQRLRSENIALLDRILALERRLTQPAPQRPSVVSGPSGAFIGSVTLTSGSRVLVDLAQGANPHTGDSVEVYGTDESGAAVLVAEGSVSVVRDGTVQITVSAAKGRLRVRDAVYLSSKGEDSLRR